VVFFGRRRRRERLLRAFEQAYDEHDLVAARDSLNSLRELGDDGPEVRLFSALLASHESPAEGGLGELERLAEQDSENPAVHLFLGEALLERAAYARASQALQRSLALDKHNARALCGLGVAHARQGRINLAQDYFLRTAVYDRDLILTRLLALCEANLAEQQRAREKISP